MKNKFIALALVTLSIATTTVSCTTNDDLKDNVKAQVETTKVDFTVQAENNATGKMIDKSVVPVYVNEVTIWANGPQNVNALQSFTFGTSTAANPLDMGFSLPNVALGSNVFGASSNGDVANERATLGAVQLNSSSADVLATMKAHTPWISTAADNVTAVIKKTNNPAVALTMKTDNGRILAKFVQAAPDADNYIATVTATIADMDEMGVWTTKTLAETTITPTTGFEWSNRFATDGQTANFVIKVYENLGGGVKGQLLNTITKTERPQLSVAVKKATTKLVTFTLNNTDVHTDIQAGGIVLTFPTIGEEVINN